MSNQVAPPSEYEAQIGMTDLYYPMLVHAMYGGKFDCVMDIGVDAGLYSSIYSTVFKSVIAIDANPTEDRRNGLLSDLANVTVYNELLHDEAGNTVTFYELADGYAGLSTVDKSVLLHNFESLDNLPITKHTMVTNTIDNLNTELNLTPDFIKIDVEGLCGNVLMGAVTTIASTLPTIQTEIMDYRFVKMIESWGYINVGTGADGRFKDSVYIHKDKISI